MHKTGTILVEVCCRNEHCSFHVVYIRLSRRSPHQTRRQARANYNVQVKTIRSMPQ